MVTGYVRQSAAGIATGLTIQASLFNAEYNALQTAFDVSAGHTHDGTTGGGAPVTPAGLSGLTNTSGGILAANGANALNVRTITGTAGTITVTNGTGVSGNPTLTIDATYLGQSSITTLGTITTGVWNGTAVPVLYGGTGATTAGVARTNLGLAIGSNVEAWNATLDAVAAGTYSGSGSITTLGTVGTGVWNGTVITGTYGGSGVNNGSTTFTRGGNVTFSGAFGFTGTLTGTTSVTFPTSGTLINSAVSTLSSLTSIGTIGTGVWNGTVITGTYGGTGVNNGANTITLGGNLTTSGAFNTTLTVTGATNVTLPTSGTLVNTGVTSLSSLATVGTITSGTWNGTAVDVAHGGTGDASFTAYSVLCGGTTSTGVLQNVSGVGTSGQVLTSNGAAALPTWQAASGLLVQRVSTETGAVATGTTSFTLNDSIPQNTDGDQYMSLSITPKNSANKLEIQVTAIVSNSSSGVDAFMGLYQDTTASALAAIPFSFTSNGRYDFGPVTFTHIMTAGTTSATTFKVRIGATGGTTSFNGLSGSRNFGGVIPSSIIIKEYTS